MCVRYDDWPSDKTEAHSIIYIISDECDVAQVDAALAAPGAQRRFLVVHAVLYLDAKFGRAGRHDGIGLFGKNEHRDPARRKSEIPMPSDRDTTTDSVPSWETMTVSSVWTPSKSMTSADAETCVGTSTLEASARAAVNSSSSSISRAATTETTSMPTVPKNRKPAVLKPAALIT